MRIDREFCIMSLEFTSNQQSGMLHWDFMDYLDLSHKNALTLEMSHIFTLPFQTLIENLLNSVLLSENNYGILQPLTLFLPASLSDQHLLKQHPLLVHVAN